MLQINEISKLHNLLAIYQLQMMNGKLVQMSYSKWERDNDGNFIEVNIPDTNNNSGYTGGNSNCCSGCDDCCTNCWNCFACCNNTVVCCRCCI